MACEVGLSGLPLDYPNSGSAVYARQLARHLPAAAPDLNFRLFLRQAPADLDLCVAIERLSTPAAGFNRGAGAGARIDKLLWEIAALPLASARRGQTLLHSLYFAAPVLSAVPLVVTIHDVIPLVLKGYHRSRQSALYSRLMARTAKRVGAIITVSQHSKKDIVRVLGVPEDRVTVTYEAVDERFQPVPVSGERQILTERYDLPSRFLLYIGGAERRKNVELLVWAWADVAPSMRSHEVKLVVVADFPVPDVLYPDIPGLINHLRLKSDIVLLPKVNESDKPALYRSAMGLLFPSRYEGFGFTPLEAMACGTPVVSSGATSLPEVVGSGGWLLDPDDRRAWSEAMVRLVESDHDRMQLSQQGIRNAARFSWQRTAEQTADVYRSMLA
ncbi:MAG: glycosyltransferase family 4 protein [Chloroflexota bacterium]|nr:MAG: hypothetical protein DLM70_06070 [Chloroflexota bacterium]